MSDRETELEAQLEKSKKDHEDLSQYYGLHLAAGNVRIK